MSIEKLEKLEKLLNDSNEAFGHGLCLAYFVILYYKRNIVYNI